MHNNPQHRWTRSAIAQTTVVLSASFLAVGCDEDAVAPVLLAPEVIASTATSNVHNVLSAFVQARARFADSVAVRFGLHDALLDSVTPAVAVANDTATVPLLGLLSDSRYSLQLVAYGGGRVVSGDALTLVTGPLPQDLPRYVASGSDPSPGYIVFAAQRYGLVIDNSGRVVWYHAFPDGPGLNFMAQPNGRYLARPTTPDATDRDLWVEIDPFGNVTRTFGCAGDLQPRFHDLILGPEGSYWVMCDETRTMDLTGVGGVAAAQVTGTVVQHIGPTGDLRFEWSPFDHFEITDIEAADRAGPVVNWTHGNALDLDADGNLIVSFRSLNEVTKIDARTGDVLWRMGGLRNEFTFEDTPMPAFLRQHSVRMTGPGHLLLLDNTGDLLATRAERFVFDDAARAARLVGSYGSSPPVTTPLGGSAEALPAGRTLVSFGTAGRVEEYDASGAVVWRIEGNAGYVFRAQRIRSLYEPGVDLPR